MSLLEAMNVAPTINVPPTLEEFLAVIDDSGIFRVPFEGGNLAGELWVINDSHIVPAATGGFWMRRGENNWIFGVCMELDTLRTLLLEEWEFARVGYSFRDEQGQEVPKEHRLVYFLRGYLLDHQHRFDDEPAFRNWLVERAQQARLRLPAMAGS